MKKFRQMPNFQKRQFVKKKTKFPKKMVNFPKMANFQEIGKFVNKNAKFSKK